MTPNLALEIIAERAMRAHLEGSDVVVLSPHEANDLLNADLDCWIMDFDYVTRRPLYSRENDYDEAIRKVCADNGWPVPSDRPEIQVVIMPVRDAP